MTTNSKTESEILKATKHFLILTIKIFISSLMSWELSSLERLDYENLFLAVLLYCFTGEKEQLFHSIIQIYEFVF